MSKVLILGETGQLALSLRALDWPAGLEPVCLGRRALGDARQAGAAAAAAIRETRPRLVLNAAAYTAVDRAEAEPELAHALNADLPLAAGEACAALGIPFVHVSSDYVFDGEKDGAYLETDATSPLGVYGASKLAGDRNVEGLGDLAQWTILRTSWVYSEIGDTFPAKLLRRAKAGEALRVVDDQTGCPTTAQALAAAMQAVGLRLLEKDPAVRGLFNYCGAEAMTWHGFAQRLLAAAQRNGLNPPPLQAIGSDAFPTPVRRPRRSVLDCGKITRQCGIRPAPIGNELDRIVGAILTR
jgi:dTDP-4-dehydrorhamnose reductase